MKAIILEQAGGEAQLVKAEAPLPAIKDHEVLVQVKAIGINPVDAYVRFDAGAQKGIMRAREGEQLILGWDISGIVTDAGAAVTAFKKGDEVFGMVNFPGQGRAYAEYVAAPEGHLALKPANISHQEAAAACLAALTAWQALVTHAKVKAGEKVLIHKAAGGVGHFALQIAKHLGAYVIGVASAGNRDFVLGLGADECIDYRTQAFEERVKDADVVLDSHPGDHIARSLQSLRQGGRLISLLGFADKDLEQQAAQKQVFFHRMSVASSGADMKALADLIATGALRPVVSHTYSFDELPQAHQQIGSGKTRGKIVVGV